MIWVLIIAAVVVLLLIWVAVKLFIAAVKEIGVAVIIWRLLVGHHVKRGPRTDAGWFTWARHDYPNVGRVYRWHRMPRALHGLVKASMFVGIPAAPWLAIEYTTWFLVFVGTLLAAALAFAGRALYRRIKAHRQDVEVLQPLYDALTSLAAYPPLDLPSKWLTVDGEPSDDEIAADEEAGTEDAGADLHVRLSVPTTFAGGVGAKMDILRTVSEHFEVPLKARWKMRGRSPHVVMTRAPRPPSKVSLADQLELIDARGSVENLLIGYDDKERPIWHRLDRDGPHILGSMGTGGGKSTFLGGIGSQVLHHGAAHLAICDPKMGASLPQLEGVPGVTLAVTTETMWWMTHQVRLEMERRYDAGFSTHAKCVAAGVQPIFLFIDELNELIAYSEEMWADLAPKGQKERKKMPFIRDIARLSTQARGARIYLVIQAQRFGADLFNPTVRDQFMLKATARIEPAAWDSVVAAGRKPYMAKVPGRGALAISGEITPVQYVYGSPDEQRELALRQPAGIEHFEFPPIPQEIEPWWTDAKPWAVMDADDPRRDPDYVAGHSRHVTRDRDDSKDFDESTCGDECDEDQDGVTVIRQPGVPARVTIAAACRDDAIDATADAMRQAMSRDRRRGLPTPVKEDGGYDLIELSNWWHSRQQVGS